MQGLLDSARVAKLPALLPSAAAGRLWRWFVVALGLTALLKTIAVAVLPISGDEAYYWMWSRHLAFGYYDNPPMVAWLIALSTAILGTSPGSARLPAVLCMMLTAWIVARVGREVSGRDDVGAAAGLLCLFAPYMVVEAGFITPNSPFLAANALALLWYHRAVKDPGDGWKWWILGGIALGLAGLSKMIALLLLPSMALFLCLSPRHRALWEKTQPWVSLCIAVAVLSPFLMWQAEHGWETFRFQLMDRHLVQDAKYLSLGRFVALQFASVSPVLMVFCVMALIGAIVKHRQDVSRLFLFCFGVVPLGVFTLAAAFVQVEMYWCIGGYVATFVLVAWSGMERWQALAGRPLRWVLLSLVLLPGMLLSLLIYTGAFVPSLTLAASRMNAPPDYRGNGVSEMYAYVGLAEDVKRELERLGPDAFAFTDNYQMSSVLTFYSGRHVHTLPCGLHGREVLRWERPREQKGLNGLYIDRFDIRGRGDMQRILKWSFASVGQPQDREYRHRGYPAARFSLVPCQTFVGRWTVTKPLPYSPKL